MNVKSTYLFVVLAGRDRLHVCQNNRVSSCGLVNKHAEVPDTVVFVFTLMASRCKCKTCVMGTTAVADVAR